MLMVSNHVEFVKRQAEFNRRQYERLLSKSNLQDNTASGRRAAGQLPLYERLTAGFEALLAYLGSWTKQEEFVGARFSKDRPTYAQMHANALAQQDAFGYDEETIACFCGD